MLLSESSEDSSTSLFCTLHSRSVQIFGNHCRSVAVWVIINYKNKKWNSVSNLPPLMKSLSLLLPSKIQLLCFCFLYDNSKLQLWPDTSLQNKNYSQWHLWIKNGTYSFLSITAGLDYLREGHYAFSLVIWISSQVSQI